jgi:hypothetical protein
LATFALVTLKIRNTQYIALPSLSPEKKHIILATQDFQAKDMIFPIMLENKAPNPIAASCLKVA